jgi:uracil phosphoribosyltransferase
MRNVTVITHPLVQHNLALLRDRRTGSQEFRRLLGEVAALMVYEATRLFSVKEVRVTTPMATARGQRLQREIVLVPVLRAGLGMLDSILQLIPHARVGFIGLKRDEETLEAISYLQSLPRDLHNMEVLLIDPMLATGGSAVAALDRLRERKACRITMVNLIAAPQGIRRVHASYADVPIYTAAIDYTLDHKGFILPGLGDAGDRLFGL